MFTPARWELFLGTRTASSDAARSIVINQQEHVYQSGWALQCRLFLNLLMPRASRSSCFVSVLLRTLYLSLLQSYCFSRRRRSFENSASRLTLSSFWKELILKTSKLVCEQKEAWSENSLLNKTFQMLSKLWMCHRSCQPKHDRASLRTQSNKNFYLSRITTFFFKISLKERTSWKSWQQNKLQNLCYSRQMQGFTRTQEAGKAEFQSSQ